MRAVKRVAWIMSAVLFLVAGIGYATHASWARPRETPTTVSPQQQADLARSIVDGCRNAWKLYDHDMRDGVADREIFPSECLTPDGKRIGG